MMEWSAQARPVEETWLIPFVGILCVLVLLWY